MAPIKAPCQPSASLLQCAARPQRPGQLACSVRLSASQARIFCKASSHDLSFDDVTYYEARVEALSPTATGGPAVYLHVRDDTDLVIPIYIGDHEASALDAALRKMPRVGMSDRPDTYGLMKESLLAAGTKVCLTRITGLRGHTFMSRMHLESTRNGGEPTRSHVDARPSDSINMAVRFDAPVYVSKQVVRDLGVPRTHLREHAGSISVLAERSELHEDEKRIHEECRGEVAQYENPRLLKELQLGLAAAEQRYEDAARLRDEIESDMQHDINMKLAIGIESALEDGRFEEAQALKEELAARRRRLQAADGSASDSNSQHEARIRAA